METNGSISTEEASAALASVAQSRNRVAWRGYPAWYWLATGAAFGVATAAILLPYWWAAVTAFVLAAAVIRLAYLAGRARGVCEGWVRCATTWRESLVLYGPMIAVMVGGPFVARFVGRSPWLPIAAGALVFLLFTGAGLTLSARAARR